jgi:hypothetical protein
MDPFILNLATRWIRVVNFTPRPPWLCEKRQNPFFSAWNCKPALSAGGLGLVTLSTAPSWLVYTVACKTRLYVRENGAVGSTETGDYERNHSE